MSLTATAFAFVSAFARPVPGVDPTPAVRPSPPIGLSRVEPSPGFLRGLLLAACLAAAGLAGWAGDPSGMLRADAELAFLLRGMAAIKASLVLAAFALLWWRLGHPVSRRSAAGYVVGASLVSGATLLIWQLSYVPLAALVFHAGVLVLAVVAWCEHRLPSRAGVSR